MPASRPTLVYVMGPAGAGKDSVLRHARERLGGRYPVAFAHRYITRPRGTDIEDYIALSPSEFALRQRRGLFAFDWSAYGFRYGIGVGREGFTWSGTQTIVKKAEWPDWTPPPEMIARQPYLPRHMAGGPGNPLGARAMYLGGTIYRIHGTNAPHTIGTRVSSGCLRLTNEDVKDLYSRVHVGTKVIVLPMDRRADLGRAIR